MKRIFVTGVSGCIGHYLAEALIRETDHELFFLVRNPAKLKFDYHSRPNLHILSGDLKEIENYGDLLKTVQVAILIATSWGGKEETEAINIVKTLELLNLLDPIVCEQVIYFSTESILDRNNQPLKEAGEIGTDYIRTKYICHAKLSQLAIAPKITTLYPTLVIGGDEKYPYSHLYGGLPDVLKYADLIRWFKADGSFHFIHARDIAQVTAYLVDHPLKETDNRNLVLGNAKITANEAVEKICRYLGKKIYFRFTLSPTLADFFIKIFHIRMAAWDKFLMDYRHFTHEETIAPASFGLPTYCPTLEDVLALRGIERKG
jgi:nucleoside-diphosphate-sugar epimerase